MPAFAICLAFLRSHTFIKQKTYANTCHVVCFHVYTRQHKINHIAKENLISTFWKFAYCFLINKGWRLSNWFAWQIYKSRKIPTENRHMKKTISAQTLALVGNAFLLLMCTDNVWLLSLLVMKWKTALLGSGFLGAVSPDRVACLESTSDGSSQAHTASGKLLQSWHFYLGASTCQASQATEESRR